MVGDPFSESKRKAAIQNCRRINFGLTLLIYTKTFFADTFIYHKSKQRLQIPSAVEVFSKN